MRPSQDQIANYLNELCPAQSQVLSQIEKKLREDQKFGINIGATEGLFLQFLIKAFSLKHVLEIGSQYGYSTQWMLESLPQDGSILSLEKNLEHFTAAKELIKDSRVEFVNCEALGYLQNLNKNSSFDLIFIDANKKSYPDYLKESLRLLKPKGFIIADNTFLFGSVFNKDCPEQTPINLWKSMREFNQLVFSNPELVPCIIPTSEGITVAQKK